MGMITYLIGRSVDARQRLLTEQMDMKGHGSVLHLVPTRGRVMELETDSRFWLKRRVNTLTGLIYQIFEEDVRYERFNGYRPIDEGLRSLLVKKILVDRGAQPDGLAYFSRLLSGHGQEADFPGVFRTVSRFFSQLVRNNFQDRFVQDLAGKIIRLEERSPGTGEEKYALESDLTWLFGDYEEIKREIRGYDEDDLISGVRSFLIDKGEPHALTGSELIVFDGFIHLTRIEEDILFHLFRQVADVYWLLDYDSHSEDPISGFKNSSGRDAIYHWTERGRQRELRPGLHEAYRIFAPLVSLMERLEDEGRDCRIERAGEERFPNPVAGGLYFHGQMGETGGDSLRLRSFAGRVDEIRAIAGEIKRIIHEDSLDPSRDLGRVRVIFPDLNDYSSLIFEIFTEYGLPFSLTKGLPLSSHPVSYIFLYIFDIALNGFRREDILRLFSSGLVHGQGDSPSDEGSRFLTDLDKAYLLNGDSLEAVKRMVGKEIGTGELDISFFDRVAQRCGLDRLGNDLSKGLLLVRDFYQDKLRDPGSADRSTELRSEYYGFLAHAFTLDQVLRSFKELTGQGSPQGILDLLRHILEQLGFPGNIVDVREGSTGLDPGTLSAMLRRDIKAYSILKDLLLASANELRVANKLFRISEGHELLTRFYAIFRQRLAGAYLLDERNPNIIRISQWLETRGRSFDYIFAGGLSADRFPLRDETDFILPESPNRLFRRLDSMDLSRHLFSHLLRNYRKRLYLSYPRYTDEKAVQPSQVLTDLESMVKHRNSQVTGIETLEEFFRWEDSPYLSSGGEMLNTFIIKDDLSYRQEDRLSPLKQIILRDEFPVEELLRSMNALHSRYASDGLFEYDGLVNGSARFYEFLKKRKEILSPSQLESLANCPMRYLFERIYGFRSVEVFGKALSPREMGEHLHAILKTFFKRLQNEGKNVADKTLGQAFALAVEVADEYFGNRPFLNRIEFFESQKREILEGLGYDSATQGEYSQGKGREGVIARLLRFEEKEMGGRAPEGLEYRFGNEDDQPVRLGKSRIHGFIDRFDKDRGDKGTVHIYDYKSGSIPSSSKVKAGLSFQLPAYMRALKQEFDIKRISAAFYALKRDLLVKESPLKQIVKDRYDQIKGLDISGVRLIDDYANQLMEMLEKGRFHHSADELNCGYCDFRYACHKDGRRMDLLLDSGAEHLIYSGRKNLEKWKKVDQFRKEWKKVSQSMQKAFKLKTEVGRRKHFESVMGFRNDLNKRRGSLPFHDEYIDEFLHEIGEFEKRYKGKV